MSDEEDTNYGKSNLEGFQLIQFQKFYRQCFYVTSFLENKIGTTNELYERMENELAEKFYEDKAMESELESFIYKAEDFYRAVMEFKTFWHLNKNKTEKEKQEERNQFLSSLSVDAKYETTNKNLRGVYD